MGCHYDVNMISSDIDEPQAPFLKVAGVLDCFMNAVSLLPI